MVRARGSGKTVSLRPGDVASCLPCTGKRLRIGYGQRIIVVSKRALRREIHLEAAATQDALRIRTWGQRSTALSFSLTGRRALR